MLRQSFELHVFGETLSLLNVQRGRDVVLAFGPRLSGLPPLDFGLLRPFHQGLRLHKDVFLQPPRLPVRYPRYLVVLHSSC